MSRFKLVSLCVLGLTALAMVGVASAAPQGLPDVLPTNSRNTTDITDLTAPIYATSTGAEIRCETSTFGKSEETGSPKPLGSFHIDFLGCVGKSGILSGKCTGLGEAHEGEILMLGSYHLVYDTGGTELGVAILLLVASTHLACAGFILEEVSGEQVCLIKEPYVLKTLHKFVCEHAAAHNFEQSETWLNDNGETIKPLLKVKEGSNTLQAALTLEALLLWLNASKENQDTLIDML